MAEQHRLAINTHGRGSLEITGEIAAIVRNATVDAPKRPFPKPDGSTLQLRQGPVSPPRLGLVEQAVGPLQQVHDRMPLIMPVQWWEQWLDPDAPASPALLAPPALELAQAIEIREVAPLVNRVANNGPQLLDPVS